MVRVITLAIGLVFSTGGTASVQSDDNNSIIEYATRTAKDYCASSNVDCVIRFSAKLTAAYKDGQNDVEHTLMKKSTLSNKYEKKLFEMDCILSSAKYKAACTSMVDRLVDSYNRGLNSK